MTGVSSDMIEVTEGYTHGIRECTEPLGLSQSNSLSIFLEVGRRDRLLAGRVGCGIRTVGLEVTIRRPLSLSLLFQLDQSVPFDGVVTARRGSSDCRHFRNRSFNHRVESIL